MDYARSSGDQDEIGNLKQIKNAQADFVEHLLSDGVAAPDAQTILSQINRYIHRQVLDNALIGIVDNGWGQLPVPFAAVIMGSGGRRESFLNPDQDNGFILEDYPVEKHGGIDPFFIELAERFTTDLDRIGIPFCKGYIMATNPAWRKTSTQWRHQLSYWKRHPSLIVVRQADIFFDFEPFFGEEGLSVELRRYVSKFAQSSPGFLRDMHSQESSELGVALTLFGRLRSEKEDPEHAGEINLKYGALLPLTQSVRLLALRQGIEESSTLERINRLNEMGEINTNESHRLTNVLSKLSDILLRQQIRDFREGISPSYYVPLKQLSQWERDEVVESLKSIANFRDRVDEELTGRA
jgi:signal-transduction protein with cAMP-binding, CBS, and nucleotidyltransferase domain